MLIRSSGFSQNLLSARKDAESTLLLNDDWKIDGLAGLTPQEAGVEKELPSEEAKAVVTAQVEDKTDLAENGPEAAMEEDLPDAKQTKVASEAKETVEAPVQPVKKTAKSKTSEPSGRGRSCKLEKQVEGCSHKYR